MCAVVLDISEKISNLDSNVGMRRIIIYIMGTCLHARISEHAHKPENPMCCCVYIARECKYSYCPKV
jgi:hypothetical protein